MLPQAMLPLCVPSWVIPGSVAENAAFLREKVHAVMLCAFEHAPRLPVELPPSPEGLAWHIHLPTDLPWHLGGAAAANAACAIVYDAKHLFTKASFAVLHPPKESALLTDFITAWLHAGLQHKKLILENVPEHPLAHTLDLAKKYSLDLCIDVAHLVLSDDMKHVIEGHDIFQNIRMIHWSAPCNGKDAHAPLTQYDAQEQQFCKNLAAATPTAVDVIEVFSWQGICDSWELLRTWRS